LAENDAVWQEIKGEHFVVYYQAPADKGLAQQLARRAESYYQSIGNRIGYTRYSQFWTWDKRVKILLFPDQASFARQMKVPNWSSGYANRDSQLFNSRVIATYRQEGNMLDGLLPHEISHLALHDYISPEYLPVWFDEGVAQVEEQNKKAEAAAIMPALKRQGELVPLAVLNVWDVRRETDPRRVAIFYAQSVALTDFLATRYGAENFRRLCQELRKGKSFEAAISSAYGGQFNSLDDLDRKWQSSF